MSRILVVASLLAVAAALTTGAGAASAAVTPTVTIKFAAVSSTGSLLTAQSNGATSALRAAQGKYKIVFDSSIERCAVSAASLAGNTSTNTYGYDTRIMTYISGSSLYVTLMSANDGPGDYSFSVVLACKSSVVSVTPTPGKVVVTTPTNGTVTTPTYQVWFATVSATGALQASQSLHATSASRAAQGKFKIVFDTSITKCAVASASLSGNSSTNVYGYDTRIMTYISGSTLYVTLMSKSDGPGDYPFSVLLACNT